VGRMSVDFDVYEAIRFELASAREKYPPRTSIHEGYAIIKEELDELWDEVRASKNMKATSDMAYECIQIAAMSIRFIEDLYIDS
jgi:hypothetical protein